MAGKKILVATGIHSLFADEEAKFKTVVVGMNPSDEKKGRVSVMSADMLPAASFVSAAAHTEQVTSCFYSPRVGLLTISRLIPPYPTLSHFTSLYRDKAPFSE